MTTLIFARADHPSGYGSGGEARTAHGYSLVLVRCDGPREVADVVSRMERHPFYGFGNPGEGGQYHDGCLHEWFGGRFDFLGSTEGEVLLASHGRRRFSAHGDNRFIGIFDAQEVLESHVAH